MYGRVERTRARGTRRHGGVTKGRRRDPRGSRKERRGQGGARPKKKAVGVEAEAKGRERNGRKRALKRSKRSGGLKKEYQWGTGTGDEKDGLEWDQRWSEKTIQEGQGGGGDEIRPEEKAEKR